MSEGLVGRWLVAGAGVLVLSPELAENRFAWPRLVRFGADGPTRGQLRGGVASAISVWVWTGKHLDGDAVPLVRKGWRRKKAMRSSRRECRASDWKCQ